MTEESKRSHVPMLFACLIAFALGLTLRGVAPNWASEGYSGRALTALRSGGDDMRQIVAVWCDYNKILVIDPNNQKWRLLQLEGQCAKSCDPHATHVRIGRSLECEWLIAKPEPKPLIPEKPKITPAVSLAKGGARCSRQS